MKMFIRQAALAALLILTLCITGCGNTAVSSETIGQVKTVTPRTPLFFQNFVSADLSLGIMKNGVGSMSREDIEVRVDQTPEITAAFKKASETGGLVKVTYDTRRFVWYGPNKIVTKIEEVK